jgi:histidinol-phosphate aminotransferase
MWYGARALAGLRVGYAISDDGLIEALIRVKNSFNSYPLGRPAQAGAIAALGDEEHFQRNRSMVIEERDRMTRELSRLGFEMLPSKANFVFADHPAHGGGELAAALREQRVLVRHFDKPRIANYVRITVGASTDTDRLLAALTRSLKMHLQADLQSTWPQYLFRSKAAPSSCENLLRASSRVYPLPA